MDAVTRAEPARRNVTERKRNCRGCAATRAAFAVFPLPSLVSEIVKKFLNPQLFLVPLVRDSRRLFLLHALQLLYELRHVWNFSAKLSVLKVPKTPSLVPFCFSIKNIEQGVVASDVVLSIAVLRFLSYV